MEVEKVLLTEFFEKPWSMAITAQKVSGPTPISILMLKQVQLRNFLWFQLLSDFKINALFYHFCQKKKINALHVLRFQLYFISNSNFLCVILASSLHSHCFAMGKTC